MDEIHIEDYDARWPERYQEEAEYLISALGEMIKRIEHIGSTSIPGLAAKPIIDILIGVDSVDDARPQFVPILEAMGYTYWADDPNKTKMLFIKGLPPNGPRTHHIHVERIEGGDWDPVYFRDYLRAHPEEIEQYEALKRKLAIEFRTDRESYTKAKGSYIKEITARAKLTG